MQVVYTIGYEGTTIEKFIATLLAAQVSTLVDVRALALSRKRVFSKNALSDRVLGVGLNYIHMDKLGDPREGRNAARAGDIKKFRRIYTSYLKHNDAREALETLISLARE